MLARKSILNRIWMTTGKKVYYWATRDVLRYSDHEGHGRRLVHDAPLIAARLKAHPQVREVLIAAYPDLRKGTGLYAFVEGAPGLAESTLRHVVRVGLCSALGLLRHRCADATAECRRCVAAPD